MLQFITHLPEHVIGIRATGEVTREDYERVLIPKMEEFLRRQGEVNYLFILETDIKNFTLAAWWKDFIVALKSFTRWKKVAIVSDQKSVEWMSDMLTHFIPGHARGFKTKELDDALAWVSEKEVRDPAQEQISIHDLRTKNTGNESAPQDGGY